MSYLMDSVLVEFFGRINRVDVSNSFVKHTFDSYSADQKHMYIHRDQINS